MKVNTVEYTGSFGYPAKLPREARPEVALFGRSNVGKSSLINTLMARRGVARISKTPGKTRSANFFLINERFFLVDMPGYGYARAPKLELERWGKLFTQYLEDGSRHNALIQLIDSRHEPTGDDIQSVRRMARAGRPLCLVFNKCDKVKRGAMRKRVGDALAVLDVPLETAVIPFSSVSGEGKRELWTWIESMLEL